MEPAGENHDPQSNISLPDGPYSHPGPGVPTRPARPRLLGVNNGNGSRPGAAPPGTGTALTPWLPESTNDRHAADEGQAARAASELPVVPDAADLACICPRWIWPALCFGVTLLVYLALVPRFLNYDSPPTGDQPFYLLTTISIVQDHDLNQKNQFNNRDWRYFYDLAPHPPGFVGMSAPDPIPPHPVVRQIRPNTEIYDFHHPGLPVLLVAPWVIGGLFSLWYPATVVFMCLVGALVALNIFLFAYETTGRPWIALVVWVVTAFANPLMTYSYLIFTELPAGLLVIYAFRRLMLGWRANGPWRLLLVGACIAYLPWLEWRYVALAAPLGLLAVVQWWRDRRARESADEDRPAGEPAPGGPARGIGRLAILCAPVALSAGLIILFHEFLFGQIVPPGGVPELGDVNIFHWPWAGGQDLTFFVTTAFAHLFDRTWGLLIYTPVYLLAVVGMIAMWRSGRDADRRLLAGIWFVALPTLMVITAFQIWNGSWCPPARFLTTLVPLLAAPLAMSLFALSGSVAYKIIFGLLALPGLILMAVMMNYPHLFWPQDNAAPYAWLAAGPFHPFHIDVRPFLPTFTPPDNATHPVTTGWLVLASIIIVFVCWLLMRRQDRDRTRTFTSHTSSFILPAAGWLSVVAVIGLGWTVMNYNFMKPRTEFVEQRRWTINPQPVEPYGIAYLDGKVYIPSFNRDGNGWVGALDTATGQFKLIQPVDGGVARSFAHPSDIKVGPNGLLYVLNNGEADAGMFAMQPDGKIVRKITLVDKTWIATGLNFGPDGNMYIADMLGGRIRKYAPEGGKPLGSWGGEYKGFNNPAGVAVPGDGNVYATETGYQRVQVLGKDGKFEREYALGCRPVHAVANGDWIDVTCGSGLVSINDKGEYVHLAGYPGRGDGLNSPTGLVYAPDGTTLYVIDGATLIEYKVKH